MSTGLEPTGALAYLLRVFQSTDVVGHGHQRLILAVSDVEPPPLLLLLWEVQTIHSMRDLGLGLQQGSLSPLDALLQGLPLLQPTLQNMLLIFAML